MSNEFLSLMKECVFYDGNSQMANICAKDDQYQ